MHPPDRLTGPQWASLLLDEGHRPLDLAPGVADPLRWPGYAERVGARDDALQVFAGGVDGVGCVLLAGEFATLGGSMGTVVGRRVRAAFAHATAHGLPVVSVASTGGARMQEGIRALVQMPGTVAAALEHGRAGLLQLGIAADPTTGGVNASFLSHADLLAAEAGAYVAFAGPRVVEAVAGRRPGPHVNRASSAYRAGLVDAVLPRGRLRGWVAAALAWTRPGTPEPVAAVGDPGGPVSAWEAVTASRAADRPRASDLLERVDPVLLSGDRAGGRDPVTLVALARLHGRRVMVVAQDGAEVQPGGYRTAWRGLALASRHRVPVLALIDTPGADPRPAAEAAGQTAAISGTLARMLAVEVPTVAVVVGQGGSGGAMALAAADRLLVQRTSTFSVIAPEAAAAILRRDDVPQVAELLRLRAHDLVDLGVADAVVPDDPDATLAAAVAALDQLAEGPWDPQRRLRRWMRIADGTADP